MKEIGWLFVNAVQGLLLAVWTVVCCVIVVLVMPFGRELPLRVPRLWSRALLWLGGIRLRVDYEAEIDWSKPHVFVMNHQSMVDIPVACLAIPVPIRFVAKRVLAFVPFVGWYMKAVGMVFVDRSKSAQAIASMQKAGELLRQGASIIAFPEGTRSPDGRILPFKKGAFVVALQTGTPIVPIAIHGARECLPPKSFRPRPGTVRVKVGAPVPTDGLSVSDRDELVARVRNTILRMNRELGGPGGDERQHVAPRGDRVRARTPQGAARTA